jgi:NAD(P)-dependent dehydrogenase (short-subunit alcohol dehydrogenase family)
MKHAIILSITSDIGLDLARRLFEDGYSITGTYRTKAGYDRVRKALPAANLIDCDISNSSSLNSAITSINQLEKWDLFISCPCNPLPLKSFYDSDIQQWEDSFFLNSLAQLRFLHGIYPSISKESIPTVLFFAGGGTNNAVKDFSAYTSAKIHLIKMIELLAFEDPATRYLILGPGWTDTKTHQITLANTYPESKKHMEVKEFLKDPTVGTPFVNIYLCLLWLMSLPAEVVSGRNYSVVHDLWSSPFREMLEMRLRSNPDFYKLRRLGNEVFPSLKDIKTSKRGYSLVGRELNLMKNYPAENRPIYQRYKNKKNGDGDVEISDYGNLASDLLFEQLIFNKENSYDKYYFDGDRNQGYGGYKYDKKYWFKVAADIIASYGLKPGDRVLEVGCAKGYLLHDLLEQLPGLEIRGIDVSTYAVSNAMDEIKEFITVGDAVSLPFEDGSFDLVLCINTLSELSIDDCKKGILEISRVSKGKSFITLNSWRNEAEQINLCKWNLTARSNFSVDQWKIILSGLNYRGDYFWFFAT